jgi:hypothetical protein
MATLVKPRELTADERRLVWEDERARRPGGVPVAELLRVF